MKINISGIIVISDIAKNANRKLITFVSRVRPKNIGYYNAYSDCFEKCSYSKYDDVKNN